MKIYHNNFKLFLLLSIVISLFLTACNSSSVEINETSIVETQTDQISSGEQTVIETENQETVDTVQTDDSSDLLYTKPPTMTINYGDYAVSIDACGYSWFYSDPESEDSEIAIMADSAHPLDQNYSERVITLNLANSIHEISMNFEFSPANIDVITYWPAPNGADALPHQSILAPDEEIDYDSGISYDNTADITASNMFLAFEGNYIYEICATFEADKFHGNAYYTVLIKNDSYSTEE